MAEETTSEQMHTKKEAAAIMHCSEITIHRAIKQKRLGCYRIGTKVLIGQSHIEQFLRKCERKPKEAA